MEITDAQLFYNVSFGGCDFSCIFHLIGQLLSYKSFEKYIYKIYKTEANEEILKVIKYLVMVLEKNYQLKKCFFTKALVWGYGIGVSVG